MPRPFKHPLSLFIASLIPYQFISSSQSSQPSSSLTSTRPSNPIHPPATLCSQPKGLIEDASCHFETIDDLNRRLHTELNHAVQLPIFRFHKVDLYRQCPFWSEDGACGNRACAVDELALKDIPQYWRTPELSRLHTAQNDPHLPNLDIKPCNQDDQDYCILDDSSSEPSQGVYVDLLANPERFTGYAGASASRIWAAIYEENCFDLVPPSQPSSLSGFPSSSLTAPKAFPPASGPLRNHERDEAQTCLEKRVYYKLLSGLHTSISIHICDEYLDPVSGKWVPNLQCYLTRVGAHPDRLQNLYFAYTMMLRALSKSADYLRSERVELCTGDDKIDQQTRHALDQLIATAQAYPGTFDETSMFASSQRQNLKEEFKMHFRNVSRIMDCVGCDKCRLWGKLQIMGLGTGLKLLFEYEEGDQVKKNFHLSRPELIAFINTLHRLSESLEAVGKFRRLWDRRLEDGTLPHASIDERQDSLVSGQAALAIELKPGLGPRITSEWPVRKTDLPAVMNPRTMTPAMPDVITPPTKTPAVPDVVSPELSTNARVQEGVTPVLIGITAEPDLRPTQTQHRLSVFREPKPTVPPSPISENEVIYKQHYNRNASSSFDILTDPLKMTIGSSKFLRILASRCKRSCVACYDWIDDAIGQLKTLVGSSTTPTSSTPQAQLHSSRYGSKNEL